MVGVKGEMRSVAELPGRPRLTVIGGGDGLRQISRLALDDDRIAHRRFVDDDDAADQAVLDLDVSPEALTRFSPPVWVRRIVGMDTVTLMGRLSGG